MWKKVLLSVFGLIAVLAVLAGVKASQIGAMIEQGESFVPPPTAVTTSAVEEAEWSPSLRAVGTVVAARGVMVAAEVPGLVKRLAFESGQRVRRGDVLVELDSAIERAQLSSAKANLELAEVNLRRTKALAEQRINAPAELDAAEAQAKQARAQVDNIAAQIAKKTIRAPFDGKLGIREVELGQIVSPGTPLVRLQDLDRVYVDFYLPQRDLERLEDGQAVRIYTDAKPGRQWTGAVDTIEPTVDVSTRNVRVRAVFANEDGTLRPGLFAEVRVDLPAGAPVLVVPATAVNYAPYGNSVFVVKDVEEARVADQVFVELGERRGDYVAITRGLAKGQDVVTAGGFKLNDGMSVAVDNARALAPKLEPQPEDS